MNDVPKTVAAQVAAIAVPLAGRSRAEEDRSLVREAQNGNDSAFEELVRRHQQRVFALVGGILRRREDVEDVAQQVFLKAFVSIRRFDQRSAFSTWLYKISVNECWDYLRKKKVRPLVYESDLSEEQVSRLDAIVSSDRQPEAPSDRAEAKDLLEKVLGRLPEQDRQLLFLKEVEGFSVEELAQILDLNVNTVKVRLFRARGRIMDHYRKRVGARAASAGSSPGAGERKGAYEHGTG